MNTVSPDEQWERIIWEFESSERAIDATEDIFRLNPNGKPVLPKGRERFTPLGNFRKRTQRTQRSPVATSVTPVSDGIQPVDGNISPKMGRYVQKYGFMEQRTDYQFMPCFCVLRSVMVFLMPSITLLFAFRTLNFPCFLIVVIKLAADGSTITCWIL